MLTKCCGPRKLAKGYWLFWQVLWADTITIRKCFGCSLFFMVTGVHPILPLDVQEVTWLVKLPDHILMTEELIGYHARALAKHRTHVVQMHERVTLEIMEVLIMPHWFLPDSSHSCGIRRNQFWPRAQPKSHSGGRIFWQNDVIPD